MKNDYLEYYGEHNISPVKQDISNIEIHYERRKKLYRQCGIPTLAFRNAEILEVGPGGGYNTLAFFQWNSKHIDLVEANNKGIEDMQKLFAEQNISCEKYDIFPCKIEEYKTDKRYDIIIAEGFLANIYNQKEVINKLQDLVAKNGIIVITCIDNVSPFIEIIKRLVGVVLTANMQAYDQKLEYLTDLFAPQLAELKGVSRSATEWVQDQILCPVVVNGTELTMAQAIDYFGDEFDVLGFSPRMFTDYSWYKDIWYDYKKDYKQQFGQKRLSLMLANMPELILPVEGANILVKHFENIKKLESEYEKSFDMIKISHIIEEVDSMEEIVQQYFEGEFLDIFHEIKEVLLNLADGQNIRMDKFPNFFAAFGRTQQYISFVRRE